MLCEIAAHNTLIRHNFCLLWGQQPQAVKTGNYKKIVKHTPSCIATPWHRLSDIDATRFQLEIFRVLIDHRVWTVDLQEYP